MILHNIILSIVSVVALVSGFVFGLLMLGKRDDIAMERALRERDEEASRGKQCDLLDVIEIRKATDAHPIVWSLKDGTFVAYWQPDQWGWYSPSGEFMEALPPLEALHKLEAPLKEKQ